MTEEDGRNQLFGRRAKDYLVMPDHKTADALGEAVKFVPPCLRRAFEIYWGLPKYCKPLEKGRQDTDDAAKQTAVKERERANKLALRPTSGKGVCFSTALGTFSKRYLPGWQALGVNLWRKRFTDELFAAAGITEEKLKMMETSDKHKDKTAIRVYFAISFMKEADICRRAYINAFGEPPVWPSPGEALEDVAPPPLSDAEAEDEPMGAIAAGPENAHPEHEEENADSAVEFIGSMDVEGELEAEIEEHGEPSEPPGGAPQTPQAQSPLEPAAQQNAPREDAKEIKKPGRKGLSELSDLQRAWVVQWWHTRWDQSSSLPAELQRELLKENHELPETDPARLPASIVQKLDRSFLLAFSIRLVVFLIFNAFAPVVRGYTIQYVRCAK